MSGLSEAEREVVLDPCDCGHTLNDHGSLGGCWVCSEESEGGDWCMVECEALMAERIARIVAARVAAAEQRITEGIDVALGVTEERTLTTLAMQFRQRGLEEASRLTLDYLAALARPTDEATEQYVRRPAWVHCDDPDCPTAAEFPAHAHRPSPTTERGAS